MPCRRTSSGRFLLADARGSGLVGQCGAGAHRRPDSRDASALPGRLRWTSAWRGTGPGRAAAAPGLLPRGELRLRIEPGSAGLSRLPLPQGASELGQWPAAWLAGLGTPWNTCSSAAAAPEHPGLRARRRRRAAGASAAVATLDLRSVSSRLSTLDTLGSYRLVLSGDGHGDGARLTLSTCRRQRCA
jgi:general secretion pathway protein N